MKTLTLFILSFLTLFAQDQSVYTLTGQKDPRYTVTYVATNLKEGCGSSGYTTGTMKPSIARRSMSVPDGNYTINLPIYMTSEEDKAGCGYRFGGLELTMKRKNDDQYSRFQLLGDYRRYTNTQEPDTIYRGSEEGGQGSPIFVGMDRKLTPKFISDKKYFRIAPETTFVCMTQNRIYEYERPKREQEYHPYGNFMCTMKMKLDTDGGKFHFNECTKEEQLTETQHRCWSMTHPDFGVDEITSDIYWSMNQNVNY
ncbi:MAG: hypothetical protein WCW84_03945 [Sulfurimonas sp.]|jgi:hypothetical protein